MLIKEICTECGLTKKAVEYYESKDLLSPQILKNGYRDYSEDDVLRLKEISVLRKCGVDVADIKLIISSDNKSAALKKVRYIAENRAKRLEAVREGIDGLIDDYDIERAFERMQENERSFFTIKERLALAFPGSYGLFVAMHFGRFLGGVINTAEQKTAYDAVITYLDSVDASLSPTLSDFMENLFPPDSDAALFEEQIHEKVTEMLDEPEEYIEKNKSDIAQYLKFATSDEFKASPAGELRTAMLDFQRKSGYKEHLVDNMKILSSEYADYLAKLHSADAAFIGQFPQVDKLYQ